MKREQQRKLRELKKTLPKMLKEKAKAYKMKKKDYMIWYSINDLFIECMIDVRETVDDRCCCSIQVKIKPLWIDDLLWDCLGMENNKAEPMSLRAIGAFTVSGVEVYSDYAYLKEWTREEMETYVDLYLEKFNQIMNEVTIDDFYAHISDNTYHEELRVSLTMAYNTRYQEAIEYLKDKGEGIFCNKGLWIHDGIKQYCKTMMNKQQV
ncbi:hypothetical protein [Longicatena caecimuris]|uniref:Uncharacterized protein n=1 Tax=Longicatena caecimuris TaxID=1796635 RepID=A0A4R3TIW6_9FIRM|nr:hypothetical protein [Longicatena caecimuris]MCR1869789.1 hypothetical protein [Longicatena caecimuris]MCU0102766.1 hypothetical protein [Longicatena caecimuris]TCU62213.1 hypothetical protein EDD61_10519 [Longicatena caecimuris]